MVTFTNDYGVKFRNKTITEITTEAQYFGRLERHGFMYFYEPSDSPWFPVKESQLTTGAS